jgi:hypothetical protein
MHAPLPLQVLWPMGESDETVLRLVPDRVAILNSRERTPFLLFVETIKLPVAAPADAPPADMTTRSDSGAAPPSAGQAGYRAAHSAPLSGGCSPRSPLALSALAPQAVAEAAMGAAVVSAPHAAAAPPPSHSASSELPPQSSHGSSGALPSLPLGDGCGAAAPAAHGISAEWVAQQAGAGPACSPAGGDAGASADTDADGKPGTPADAGCVEPPEGAASVHAFMPRSPARADALPGASAALADRSAAAVVAAAGAGAARQGGSEDAAAESPTSAGALAACSTAPAAPLRAPGTAVDAAAPVKDTFSAGTDAAQPCSSTHALHACD